EGGEEADALGRSLLVTVTSFFRDRPAWEALRDVLAEAWAGRDAHRPVRVWVPGCATGEEAYTAAMIVAEVLGAGANLSDRVKVFATDLSDSALEVARRGQYSEDVTATIPEHLRERWLRRAGADWQVIPALRDAVVFARHNVAQDPPFPHIDVVSLRNTLIYFTGPLQAKVLNFCHFALVPGGVLFLGQSERPTGPTGAFAAVDDQARIYRRSAAPFPAPLPVPVPERIPLRRGDPLAPPSDQRLVMRDALIDQFTPPALVVDANDDVIEVIGDVSPWCWVAPGQPSAQVVALLREELRVPVRSLLVQTRYGGPDQQPRAVMTPAGDTRLESRRLGPAEAEWVLLTFNPVVRDPATAPSSEQSGPGSERADGELQSVRDELVQTRAALQDTTEDLSASNEELRAMNEELQASAEELQASSEEVQATNEELQATNEELTVLNTELRERGTDLAAINDHLQNVQGSLTSGMIVVDRDLRVRSFTPLAVRLFVLIDADLGRPLTAVHPTVPVPDLHDRLRASVEHGTRSMLELSGQSADYLVAFQPYLQGGQIDGAIVVVTDITDLMATRRALADSENRYRLVAENATDVVWQSDPTGALVWVSPSVEPEFGWDRKILIGRNIRDLIHPDDLAAAGPRQVQLQAGASVPALEARALAADGGYRWMSLRGHLITDADGSPVGVIVGMRNIDEEVVARTALAHAIDHDPLTGLATLPVAITRVERLLADLPARPRRVVGVLCVGVDSLTPVNQALTHTGGDRVLL
ncbi:MAG: CheR family methyltransferase, partial [Actinomycetes bacterium]